MIACIPVRFGLRSILLATVAVAIVCALFVAARSAYYSDRRQIHALLEEVVGISDVNLRVQVEGTEDVRCTSMSVDGCPDSNLELVGLELAADNGTLSVTRIGKWKFRTSGKRHMGAIVAATGKPIESEYFGNHVVFGRQSPYNNLVPFEMDHLQDLVDHYSELVDLLESWPREADPGKITLEDGTTQYYYVVEEPRSSPSSDDVLSIQNQ